MFGIFGTGADASKGIQETIDMLGDSLRKDFVSLTETTARMTQADSSSAQGASFGNLTDMINKSHQIGMKQNALQMLSSILKGFRDTARAIIGNMN